MLNKQTGQGLPSPPGLPPKQSEPAERFLRITEVAEMVGLSRTTIYTRIRTSNFPKPVPLGGERVAFLLSEIRSWMAARVAERQQ